MKEVSLREHLKRVGSLGGKATSKKYGAEHYKKMVKVRENKKAMLKEGLK